MNGILDAARFADGMTFEAYVAYTGTPENLAREAGWWLGPERQDLSGIMRDGYERARVTDAQRDAIRWLAAQPNGPANVVVLSEEWSSDCRRDVPMLARLAEAGGLALRVFTRDGRTLGRGPKADPIASPNADLVNAFLNEKGGETFQSVPVAAFFTRTFDYLAHYTEYPAIYHKDRLAKAMQARRPGESEARAWPRFIADWGAMQQTPFFMLWAGAAVDEILSALYEKVIA
jgi:hypothetical protein